MIKLLSLVLSFTLIFTSVAPSVAQVVSAQDKQAQQISQRITESAQEASSQTPFGLTPLPMTQENVPLLSTAFKANTPDSVYLAEITNLLTELTATADDEKTAEAPKPVSLAEFEPMFRQANQKALTKALAKTDNPLERDLLEALWEEWVKKHLQQAYDAYVAEYNRLLKEAETNFKKHLKQLSDRAVSKQFLPKQILSLRRNETDDPTLYKVVDPVSQFLPVMLSAFGEEVVSKETRATAAAALQKRVQQANGACTRADSYDCAHLLEEAHMLALLATTNDQLQTVADVLVDHAAMEGGISPAFINTLGADLLAVGDLDKNYSKLFYALTAVVNKAEKMDYQENFLLSAVTWVDLARELSTKQAKFSRPFYNASFYKDPKDNFDNKYSAWIDLGFLIGRNSQKDAMLRNVINSWLETQNIVVLRGQGDTRTRFNLLLTGLLAGGFQVDLKGTHEFNEMYTDVSGRVQTRRVASTVSDVAAARAWLKEKGLTQSEWLAFVLYNNGAMELDPTTVHYIRNYLTHAIADKTKAEQLGMRITAHPTTAEAESYAAYVSNLKSAAIVDLINQFLFETAVIVVVFKGVGAAWRFGALYARAVRLATAATRSGKVWTAFSQAGRLSRIASKVAFGAETPMQSLIKVARTQRFYPNFFVDSSELAAAAKALKPVTAGMGGGYIVLDGTARLVPQGFKYVQFTVNGATRFALVENTPQAVAKLANTYGLKAAAISDAVSGATSAARTTAQVYTTTGAAGVHTGATGMVRGADAAATATETATKTVAQNATKAAAETATETATQASRPAAWVKTPAVNKLGQTVQSWKPVLLETPTLTAPKVAPRALSWSDKVRLWWELDVKPLFRFGTSRYGAASLTSGAMPLTGEAAITGAQQWGQGIEVVERIRTAQHSILSMEELTSGAGASYRVLTANRGGLAAQRFAQATQAAQAAQATSRSLAGAAKGMGYLSAPALDGVTNFMKEYTALLDKEAVQKIGLSDEALDGLSNFVTEYSKFVGAESSAGSLAGAGYLSAATISGMKQFAQEYNKFVGAQNEVVTPAGVGYLTPATLSGMKQFLAEYDKFVGADNTALTPAGVGYVSPSAVTVSLTDWLNAYNQFVGAPAKGETLGGYLAEQDRLGYNPSRWEQAAGYLVPPIWQKLTIFQTPEQTANHRASDVLSQQYPLATALVQILQSPASLRYKKAAILKLYHRGKLTAVLKALENTNPEAYNRLVQLRSTEDWDTFGAALYDLYRLGVIAEGVNNLTDAETQASLLSELGYLIEDEDFQHQAGVLYRNDVKVVPTSQQTFQGDVPTVPQADQQKIANTFRTEETIEVAAGKDTGAYTHYEGSIPFYYRRADGTVTDKPVGVLSQNKAGWYNTMLSYIPVALERDPYLNKRRIMWGADRAGLDVPKGFVLALDEQGQWKFVMPTGNRAMVESVPTSKALLNKIQQEGSVRVAVDTPYTSTDLLAMARMMEHHPNLRLQLTLNPPSSLRPWLKLFGGYIGLDAAASLTGPYKEGVKGIKTIPTGALSNGVSGAGYVSPWIGGWAMKWMTKFGYVPSILGLSGISFAGLLYALFGLGLDGRAVTELSQMSTGELLTALSMPMLLLVITASLFGALVPVILNIFKDPTTRTSANLQFATTKQYSRLFLTLASFGLAYKPIMNFIGIAPLDWTIVVPAALGLLTFSTGLFINTPMFRNWWAGVRGKKDPAAAAAAEEPVKERKATAEEQKEFERLYNEEFLTTPGVRAMKSRVRGVYWAYAATLMMIGQLSSALLKDPISGVNYGQLLVAGFMYATAKMRSTASRQVDQKVRTDDQFTGMSIPLLAATSALLAFMPYSLTWAGALTAVVAMLHYVGTAVPGQLDSTRIQNMVSATMQKKKQDVIDNTTLSDAEKKEKITVLGLMEKDWASRASATYSYANGFGLWGVGGAAALAGIFMDKWAPDAVVNSLSTIGALMGHGGEAPAFTMDRLVFLISTALLARLTYRNWDMTKDFLGSLFKKKVTQTNIDSGLINAGTFGVTPKNAEAQLASANKELNKMKDKFFSYGVVSEKKMTDLYNQMSKLYNRLVAIHATLGMTPEVKAAFDKLMGYGRSYQTIIQNNHLSEMLQREFAHMAQMMSVDGALQQVAEHPQYVEQGVYQMPQAYQKFEDAAQLINEMDLMAHHIISGQSVSANMYALFIEYYNRVTEQLQEYRRTNVADSRRAALLFKRMNSICKQLKLADDTDGVLMTHKGPTSAADVQALRDMLAGYLVAHPEDGTAPHDAAPNDGVSSRKGTSSWLPSGMVYSSIIPGLPLAWNLMQRVMHSFKKSATTETAAQGAPAQPELTVSQEETLIALSAQLDQLEAYANAHDGKLPSVSADETTTQAEADLMWEVSRDFWRFDLEADIADEVLRNHPAVKRYQALLARDAAVQERADQLAAQEKELAALSVLLDQLEAYAKAHDGNLPSWSVNETTTREEADLIKDVSTRFLQLGVYNFSVNNNTLNQHPVVQRYHALQEQALTAQDRAAAAKIAAEKAAQEKAAQEKAAQKKAAQERIAAEKAAKRELAEAQAKAKRELAEAQAKAEREAQAAAKKAAKQQERLEFMRKNSQWRHMQNYYAAQGALAEEELALESQNMTDDQLLSEQAIEAAQQAEKSVALVGSMDESISALLNFYDKLDGFSGLRSGTNDRLDPVSQISAQDDLGIAAVSPIAVVKNIREGLWRGVDLENTKQLLYQDIAARLEAVEGYARQHDGLLPAKSKRKELGYCLSDKFNPLIAHSKKWQQLRQRYLDLLDKSDSAYKRKAYAESVAAEKAAKKQAAEAAEAERELQPMSDAQLDAQAVSAATQADKAVPFVGFMDGAINALLNFYDKLDGIDLRGLFIYDNPSADEPLAN